MAFVKQGTDVSHDSSEADATSSDSIDITKSLLQTNATLEQFCFDGGGSLSSSSSPTSTPRFSSNHTQGKTDDNKLLPTLCFKPHEKCDVVEVVEDVPVDANPTPKKRRRSEESFSKTKASTKRKEDVSVHARKASWVAMYGEARIAKCCVCEFNEVGWTNIGFDMAHVVPRSLDGNNRDGWNRVPTCGTCNGNVSSDTNLLDFVAQHYPHRLIPIVCFLYNRFSEKQPYVANKYFKKNSAAHFEVFVRTLYGTNGLESRYSQNNTKENSLLQFLRRSLPDLGTKRGRVKDDNVYAILRHYDSQMCEKAKLKAEMKDLETDIVSLQRTLDRMRSIEKEKATALTRCRNEIKRLKSV